MVVCPAKRETDKEKRKSKEKNLYVKRKLEESLFHDQSDVLVKTKEKQSLRAGISVFKNSRQAIWFVLCFQRIVVAKKIAAKCILEELQQQGPLAALQ